MGLYPVNCPSCNVVHMWFSGNLDQRCEECKKPKEFWVNDNAEGDGTFTVSRTPWFGYIHVIEKSAYDFQCKQAADLAKSFNESREYYQGIINDLQIQVNIEKGEVARLMAVAKRRNKR